MRCVHIQHSQHCLLYLITGGTQLTFVTFETVPLMFKLSQMCVTCYLLAEDQKYNPPNLLNWLEPIFISQFKNNGASLLCNRTPSSAAPAEMVRSYQGVFSFIACASVDSQVPRLTCFWKWVGVTLSFKVTNFSLQPSSMDNCDRAWPMGCLLDSSTSHEATCTVSLLFTHSSCR